MSRALARREGPAQQQGQDQEKDSSNFGQEEGVGSQWTYGSEMDPDQAQMQGGNQYAQSMLDEGQEEEAPSAEGGDQEQGEGGQGTEGGGGGGGGAPGGAPGDGDAQVEGGEQQLAGGEQEGEEAALEEGGAEQGEGQGGQGGAGGGGGGGGAGGGGGGGEGGNEAVGPQSPVAATRTPQLGVETAPTFTGEVSDEASQAIKEHSGLDAGQHRAAAQSAVDGLNADLATDQAAQVDAANAAALEARGALEGEYFASIQGGFGTALSGITGAYSAAQEQVRSAAEGVKTGITTAATTARSDLATLATESVATLNTAIVEARTTLTGMETEWMAPFTELETRRGGEFATAATSAADSLVANKDTIAKSFEGGSNPIEEAKGELKAKAARKIVDNDEQRIRSGGPTRAQEAITELDHAGIVGSFLAPLVAKVDAAATEGEGAITAAHDAALAQIDVDVESANAEVDSAAEAACTQLEEDSTSSQGDAESATDQLEGDLDTQMGDLEAQFTDTSADIATQYTALSEAWAAALV
ncbi:MAG: hypothetical protein H6740_18770, partial [Alphaproteobacteria bacterium]|nr:hypothetical protein [Alphaproteobacteria bacterium]